MREFNLSSFDEVLADIGLGNRVAALIAKRLLPEGGEDEAALDVAIMGYRQSVLEGIADVETALAGLSAQRKRLDLLQSTQTLIAERDAVLARRQQLGLASEFSRLSEQRAALQNRSEMAVAQGAQALAYVALYKALGGAPLPAELQAAEPPAEGRQP